MDKFKFEKKTKEENPISSTISLNTILRETENIIKKRIKRVNTDDNFLSNKPVLNQFIISIYQSMLERGSHALKHKHIVTITLACTPFDDCDENNVKHAIHWIKQKVRK